MSNAGEEADGNLLQNVKTFYTKGSFKSASEVKTIIPFFTLSRHFIPILFCKLSTVL